MHKRISLAAALLLGVATAQQPPALLYLGPQGTYSDAVAQAAARDLGLTPTLAPSITEVSNRVSQGAAPYGLIPIRNSSGGYVAETQGLLARTPAWRVVGVYHLAIDNVLMAKSGTRLEDIRTVISHPQPFLQSATYLRANLPNVNRVEVSSTAAAAERVAQDGDRSTAAIAAPAAASLYGLQVLANAIQDDRLNTTRFLIVQSAELADDAVGTHAVLSFQTGASADNLNSRLVTSALARLGLGVDGVLSSPVGRIESERLTVFASGRVVDAGTLRRALSGTGATLIGLHSGPVNVGEPAGSAALSEACPGYDPRALPGARLAQLAVCRLDAALLVSQSKFNTGAPVEDLEREAVVIEAGVRANPQISAEVVQAFWRGQIEASKIAQRALIGAWTARGQAPFDPEPNLITQVRPLLDAIGAQMQRDLAETWATRSCPGAVASGRLAALPSDYPAARQAALEPLNTVCRR